MRESAFYRRNDGRIQQHQKTHECDASQNSRKLEATNPFFDWLILLGSLVVGDIAGFLLGIFD